MSVLESAMDYKLKPLELWAFVTSSIKGADWTSFRQTMSMQREYKEHQAFWFIDQIREYILDLDRKKTRRRRQADDEDTSPPVDRKKSGLNTSQASNDDLREVIATLAANMAAIATKVDPTNSR